MNQVFGLSDSDFTFKIVIFGDSQTGKTTLTHRFLTNLFKELAPFYSDTLAQAKSVIGLDAVTVRLIGSFLKDISNKFLRRCNGNPEKALEELTDYFENKISSSGVNFDKMAIKFYLISEIIGCNVFPSERR